MNILDDYIAESGINTANSAGDVASEESHQTKDQEAPVQEVPNAENNEAQSGADVLRL